MECESSILYYEVLFPGPSDGQLLLSKVIAVETIIRDLHGPADATLLLPGMTRPRTKVVYADACTQLLKPRPVARRD